MSIYFLFNDRLSESSSSVTTLAIGRVTSRFNDVRRKTENEFVWNQMADNEGIHGSDSLFTGADSKVEVQLNNGSEIVLDSNSLITFVANQKEEKLILEKGRFRGNLKGNRKIKVQIGSRETVIEASEHSVIQIDRSDDSQDAKINVITGSIKVTQQAQAEGIVVQQSQSIEIAENGSKPAVLVTESTALESVVPLEVAEVQEGSPSSGQDLSPKDVTQNVHRAPAEMKSFQKEDKIMPPPELQPNLHLPAIVTAETNEEVNIAKSLLVPNYWFSVGMGVSYQSYTQTLAAQNIESRYQSMTVPSFSIRSGFQGESWGGDFSYRDAKGGLSSSSSVTVNNGEYHWKTLTAEGLYRKAKKSPLNIRFGIQQHQVPFLETDVSSGEINVLQSFISLATIGFDWKYPLAERTRFEWMMRYQHPISAGVENGSQFGVSPTIAFDGSVAGVHSLSDQLRMGVYWYGQYHNYNFEYRTQQSSFGGKQSLFFSTLEMRLGFEF